MSEELKPCPFCGGSAGEIGLSKGHGYVIIGCNVCQAQQLAITPQAAVEQWNARATPDVVILRDIYDLAKFLILEGELKEWLEQDTQTEDGANDERLREQFTALVKRVRIIDERHQDELAAIRGCDKCDLCEDHHE